MADDIANKESDSGKERRRFERYSVRFLIYDNKKQRIGVMQDLSILGMAFVSNKNYEINEIIEVNINLPTDDFAEYNTQEPLHVKVKIQHKDVQNNGKIMYGGAFLNIKSYEINQLKQAIDFMFFNLGKYSKPEGDMSHGSQN